MDLRTWMVSSLRPLRRDKDGNRAILFGLTVWSLWEARNRMVFTNASFSVWDVWKRVTTPELEVRSVMSQLPHLMKNYSQRLVGWSCPPSSWIKCNVDGSCKQGGAHAGCGGVFRDAYGSWRGAFLRNLGTCSVLYAEL